MWEKRLGIFVGFLMCASLVVLSLAWDRPALFTAACFVAILTSLFFGSEDDR